MSTDKPFYCSHCHLTVAPGDPGKVTDKKLAAHKVCIMRACGATLRDQTTAFLRKHADDAVVQDFVQKLSSPKSYDVLRQLMERALQRTYANGKGPDSTRRRAVGTFATRMRKILLREVSYVPHGTSTQGATSR